MERSAREIIGAARTDHCAMFGDAREMAGIADGAVDLVVTSPPYPMIEMWDAAFTAMNRGVAAALAVGDGLSAFELMHCELDKAWIQCYRVLKPGGIMCVNIGDAVRTIGRDFRMYPNHVRIVAGMGSAGFQVLPDIVWRKQTNAPNKFMGSGMLPAGAYVTYEHEYILLFRKGGMRQFTTAADKANRRASAYFWEERNDWFSDVWSDLKGTRQTLCGKNARDRSGAFPFELAYRLVCMFSVYGDTVLDPFAGTGTTMAASLAAGRNSMGIEIDATMEHVISGVLAAAGEQGRERIAARLKDHAAFVAARIAAGKTLKYHNKIHDVPVMTMQETELELREPK